MGVPDLIRYAIESLLVLLEFCTEDEQEPKDLTVSPQGEIDGEEGSMAEQEHIDLLKRGVMQWNEWRAHDRNTSPDLCRARLSNIDLSGADLTIPLQLHNRKRHCDHPLGRSFEESHRPLVRTNLQTCSCRPDLDILTSIGCNGSRCWIRAQPVVSIAGHDTGKPAHHLPSAVGNGNRTRRSVSQPKQRGERQV